MIALVAREIEGVNRRVCEYAIADWSGESRGRCEESFVSRGARRRLLAACDDMCRTSLTHLNELYNSRGLLALVAMLRLLF